MPFTGTSTWTTYASATPAVNADAVATLPAPGLNNRWRIKQILASYSGGATGNQLLVADGDRVNIILDLPSPGVQPLVGLDILCGPNLPVTVTLKAGGASILGKVHVTASID